MGEKQQQQGERQVRMSRRKRAGLAAVTAIVAMLGAGVASAEVGGWAFSVTPYLWLTEMDGDVAVRGHSVPVDVSFGDSLDMLKDVRGALMIHGEANRGELTGLADIYAIAIRQQNTTPAGETDLRMTTYIGELAAAYALPVPVKGLKVEALGGARYTLLRARLIVDAADVDVDKNQGWTDPFVGGRLTYAAGEKVTLSLRGDIGGFGIGSDLAWNAVGAASWTFAENWSAVLAYRLLDMDYDHNGFKYNVRTDGPALGVTYMF